jgi:CheY-like chemotaxis protein
MKLLIVDDMKSFLDLEKTFLRRADCQLFTAATGLEAIKVAQNIHPDLVILDIEMPEMNGIEAARIFAATKSLMDIPVVICSSTTRKEEALAAGAVEFVSKPVDEERFLEVIQRYVPLTFRKDARKAVNSPCEVEFKGMKMPCSLGDVSISGVFLKTSQPLQMGDKLDLRFAVPMENGAKEIQAEGMVIRATADGYGVGFSDLSEGARMYIGEFVAL